MGLRFRQFIGGVAPARRAGVSPGIINLFGEITEVSAAKTIAQIKAARGDLEILLDCAGGGVYEALEIGAAIQKRTGKSTAIVCKAESAAAIPMAVCDSVVMARDGSILVHAVSLHAPGGVTLDNIGEAGDALRTTQRNIADVLAARSKTTPSTFWTHLMGCNGGNGTRLDAESCLRYHLADSVSVWPKRDILRGQR